jgi:mRNA-degrading endonuclease RelE of RelBE toxin-antitoxin system
MSTNKEKLKAEIDDIDKKISQNDEKIKNLTEKNEDLKKRKRKANEKLQRIEDGEYGLICRQLNLTPEDLVAFLKENKEKKKKEAESTE